MVEHEKLYVLVDSTLGDAQRAVQSCHAVHEFMWKYLEYNELEDDRGLVHYWAKNHKTVIILGVNGTEELTKELERTMADVTIPFAEFREPDMNNRLTAFAALPAWKFY